MKATEKQIKEWKEKADKWDNLALEIAKYYENKDGEYDEDNPEESGNLCDIGEKAAIAFGWM